MSDGKEIRTIKKLIGAKDSSIFGEGNFLVEICDEGGGEFIEVDCQLEKEGYGKIGINPDEWPRLRAVIDQMILDCREEE